MIRNPLGRRLGAALVAALGVAALASLAPPSPAVSPCAAAGPNRAALVIEHGDGSVVTRCVAFTGSQTTGKDLLDASGVPWIGQSFGGFGVAVCSVDAEPAHYASCPGAGSYWALFVSRGGGPWQLTPIGVSSLILADGDAEGLRYVPTSGTPAAPPAPAGVCATAPAATPTTTPAAPPAATSPAARTAAGSPSPPPASTAPETGATPASADPTAAIAGATGSAATASGPAASPSPAPATPAPAQDSGGGLDPGPLLAAAGGGSLAGLALLRLAAGRRAGAGPAP